MEAGYTPPPSTDCQLGCLDQQEGLELIDTSQYYAREMGSDPILLSLAMTGCRFSLSLLPSLFNDPPAYVPVYHEPTCIRLSNCRDNFKCP